VEEGLVDERDLRALDDAAVAGRILSAAPRIDEQAEAELCRRFAPRVRLYGLKHLSHAAAASDLVQDVLIIVLEGLRAGKVREPERLVSFVFGTCRNVVIDQRRTQTRRDGILRNFAGSIAGTEDTAALAPDTERLKHCLQRLSERERTVVLMSFYDERPAAEVADDLALTAANVRVIRHRSLGRLRDCMGGAG
jgi:RNA polymerase sigma-70 factor (ECF subfamily)